MTTTFYGHEMIEQFLDEGHHMMKAFGDDYPLVLVLRETKVSGGLYLPNEDTGTNNCDTVLLVDEDEVIHLVGRSLPHTKYQARQIAGTGKANYIASGFYPDAWRRGWHFGFRAFRQNRSFQIWRSGDADLRLNDPTPGDDWSHIGPPTVGDNFHGFAPLSAGCVTVEGSMHNGGEGDWRIALDWGYLTHGNASFFNACILHFRDLDCDLSIRFGSTGPIVENAQAEIAQRLKLPLRADGDFGPMTFDAMRLFQRTVGIDDTGIAYSDTLEALGI